MTKDQHGEEFPVAVVQQVIGTLLQHQTLMTTTAAACNLNLCSLAGGTVVVNALHNDLSDIPACSRSCKNVCRWSRWLRRRHGVTIEELMEP